MLIAVAVVSGHSRRSRDHPWGYAVLRQLITAVLATIPLIRPRDIGPVEKLPPVDDEARGVQTRRGVAGLGQYLVQQEEHRALVPLRQVEGPLDGIECVFRFAGGQHYAGEISVAAKHGLVQVFLSHARR